MQKDNKRQRSQNWLNEDKVILKKLLKERIIIIANKRTDFNTNKKKEKVWDDLLQRFNEMCVGVTRTLPQLKAQWGLMKTLAKKMRADKRNQLMKTAGGLPPTTQTESQEIPKWLPTVVKIETDDDFEPGVIVSTSDVPGPSGMDEFKWDNPANPNEVQTEMPAFQIFEKNSTSQVPTLGRDSIDQWLCSNSNDININNSEVAASNNEGVKNKIKNKKTVLPSAPSPAARVAAVETECRRELHNMQMKVASLQVANEEHKSRLLYLQQEAQNAKIMYYQRKMQFYSREGGTESE